MRFRKKPVVIEAITFDELVAHGKAHGGNIVNGMPWSFDYKGHPITHENDDCYLVPTAEGTMRFNRGDMLLTGVAGEIYPCRRDIFDATYEPATAPPMHVGPVMRGAIVACFDFSDTLTITCGEQRLRIGPDELKNLRSALFDVGLTWAPDAYWLRELEILAKDWGERLPESVRDVIARVVQRVAAPAPDVPPPG